MTILFDTNVILDVLLLRKPFASTAVALMAAVERGEISGMLAATTVTTIYYLTAKGIGQPQARQEVAKLLALFAVAPVSGPVLDAALRLPFKDFEDAVIHEAARLAGAEGIVTRNGPDFTRATLRVYSPDALRAMLKAIPPPRS
jgi:predicted nucleic acid-binding protein